MTWNWEQPDWPKFSYASNALESLEKCFLLQTGEFMDVFKHVGADERNALRIELISAACLQKGANTIRAKRILLRRMGKDDSRGDTVVIVA